MLYARLAVMGAATLALCGAVHAAVPADPSLSPSRAIGASAGAEPIVVGVNTFDGARPAARAAAVQGDGPQDAASSYLVSTTRYAQDVGTFRSPTDVAPKAIPNVPLPGALWLFGSSLLAFLAIAVRRKF